MNKPGQIGSWLFNAWAVAVVATAGSLYLSEYLHFTPCSLCWYQRIFMYPLTVLLGIASARRHAFIAAYALPLAIAGGCVSAYHIYVQEAPHGGAGPFCGPTSCQDDVLNAFGFLTVPMLALAAFTLIIIALLKVRSLEKKQYAADQQINGNGGII